MLAGPAALVLYRPERDHYGFAFGELSAARHIAVIVPGVGRELNLVHDWLPWAQNLYEATERSAVVLWKGYDDPGDLAVAVADLAIEDRRAQDGAKRLSAFVTLLQEDEPAGERSVTVVAHSFGSVVAGEALANYAMACTDVVVLGSPGIGVENIEKLHLQAGHFFAEKAPRDLVAGLGVVGTDPASLTFGGTRMATNGPGRPDVAEHSNYFTRGSRTLENIGAVVMGHYNDVAVQSTNVANAVGDLVATLLKVPMVPLRAVAEHYTGPGFRLARMMDRTAMSPPPKQAPSCATPCRPWPTSPGVPSAPTRASAVVTRFGLAR